VEQNQKGDRAEKNEEIMALKISKLHEKYKSTSSVSRKYKNHQNQTVEDW
jgi:hypothetical protein